MSRFFLDDNISARDEVRALLEYNDVKYTANENGFHFIFAEGMRKWETTIKCKDNTAVIYGILPFAPGNKDKAVFAANDINSELTMGAVFVSDRAIVVRTGAELFDIYSAYEAIAIALEYNAGVVTEFWRRLVIGLMEEP